MIARELVNLMNELELNTTQLVAEDVVVHIVQLDYGMKVCLPRMQPSDA